jgi:phage tail sheath protein FI
MAELSFKSAGVSLTEIDLSGPAQTGPTGTPAGIIGTANRGPAFVPVTVGTLQDFIAAFGDSDGTKPGLIAGTEWLQNATALTYLRLLGIGKGERRRSSNPNAGSVESAGFVVGEQQPQDNGNFADNPDAVTGGDLGRTYFIGCFMSESAGSDIFSAAGIQEGPKAHPILRGVLFAASGVIPQLSSSLVASSSQPSSTDPAVAGTGSLKGAPIGTVNLLQGSTAKQEFVLLLNGQNNDDPSFPNVITASFDSTAPNYFAAILNSDPSALEDAGYYLYTHYDIHPALATVTGTDLVISQSASAQDIAFITTGALDRNNGSSIVPNYENFEDRFDTPKSPFIISQKFGGSPKDLFRVHALSDGKGDEERFKISIENITPSNSEQDPYGTFDLLVRSFNDTDEQRVVLESYRGLSLNPSSERYIARAIGDENRFFDFDAANGSQKLVVEGNYPNVSSRIRIQVTDEVDNADLESSALPAGFRGQFHLVTSGTAPLAAFTAGDILDSDVLNRVVEPPVPFRKKLTQGVSPKILVNRNLYWGVQFEKQIDIAEPNKSLERELTVQNFTRYFPNYMTTYQNVQVGDNTGAAFTSENGELDADLFNNNLFSLENIQVVTASNGKADLKEVENWTYVRQGNVVANETAKTRGFDLDQDLSILGVRSLAKFSLYMQGGFNGVNIFDNDEAEINNRAITEEMNFVARGQDEGPTVRTFRRGLDIMSEVTEVDINLLAIPGARNAVISDAAINLVEQRFDALYIMDIEERDTLNTVVTSSVQEINVQNTVNSFAGRALDSNFAAAYFPDLVIRDVQANVNVRVPPSVGVLGAFALNDRVGFPWFAPAGFTRGVMNNVQQTAVKLNRSNLDDLYEVDINPIIAFPGGPGVTVWGQKTLQASQSALDRVNVRRLLLELRRRVRAVANTFLFEPNREETLARFSAQVNPILARIQEQAGVDRYRVRIDTSTTSQADIENNTVRGVIFIQPTRTAEFVSLDFVVTNSGVTI